ncbi:hypothetical protein BUALT_Bualt07G0008400 [Buddleja alternifolia]|uniref:Homeobox domain-containing protein n=1 Tax=Buddleja alternifolia TaxID=168488 RepID=A0AAV6XHW3_9LAMI|nr:hypothetical protein BUALT_Bualt07G0008400 [Buddleja alternifolia]
MKSHAIETDLMAKTFEKHQIEALKSAFEESETLMREKKNELAAATGLDVEQISCWFSRKRARKRALESITELDVDHSRLQKAHKLSRSNEAELQKELQESKKREIGLQDENQRLKERITIAEGNKQLGSLMRFINGN